MKTDKNKNDQFDVVISFSGEDREIASDINFHLKKYGLSTFYDNDHQARLWGKNLAEELEKIYFEEGRFCLMIISKHYLSKIWTTHERRAAISRMIREDSEYILPYIVDETDPKDVPGLNIDTCYIQSSHKKPAELAAMVFDKINPNSFQEMVTSVRRELCAHYILNEIYRRYPSTNADTSDFYLNSEITTRFELQSACFNHYIEIGNELNEDGTIWKSFDLLLSYEFIRCVFSDELGPWFALTEDGKQKVEEKVSPSRLFS